MANLFLYSSSKARTFPVIVTRDGEVVGRLDVGEMVSPSEIGPMSGLIITLYLQSRTLDSVWISDIELNLFSRSLGRI